MVNADGRCFNTVRLVAFALDDRRYALPLTAVERIIRMAEITPLPKAPAIVLGVVNLAGRIVPVFDVRKRFRLPEREIDLGDQLIIAQTRRRTVALVVDQVSPVLERPEGEVVSAQGVLPGLEYVTGIARLEDGMILIHDLDGFLFLDEERILSRALADANPRDDSPYD